MTKFFRDENGATAIEYGLIGAALSVALIIALPYISGPLKNKFNALGTNITTPPA